MTVLSIVKECDRYCPDGNGVRCHLYQEVCRWIVCGVLQRYGICLAPFPPDV